MPGRVKFPSHLYIRVDRPLRAALVDAAKAEGLTVSDLARQALRSAFVQPPGATAMELVLQAEAGWQSASGDELADWHERLAAGLGNLRGAHTRTEAAAEAGTVNPAQPAVLDAYLRIAPAVIGRIETLLANIATRLDALASAAA